MDEVILYEKIQELIIEISNTPSDKKKLSSSQDKDNTNEINESLEELHLLITYLLFDLEATKRERDQLKVMLYGKTQQEDNDDDDHDKVA